MERGLCIERGNKFSCLCNDPADNCGGIMATTSMRPMIVSEGWALNRLDVGEIQHLLAKLAQKENKFLGVLGSSLVVVVLLVLCCWWCCRRRRPRRERRRRRVVKVASVGVQTDPEDEVVEDYV